MNTELTDENYQAFPATVRNVLMKPYQRFPFFVSRVIIIPLLTVCTMLVITLQLRY